MSEDEYKLSLAIRIQDKSSELWEILKLNMFELFNQDSSDLSLNRFIPALHTLTIKHDDLFDEFIDECFPIGMGFWLLSVTDIDVMSLYSEEDDGTRVYFPSNNTEPIIQTAFIEWSKKGGIK